MYIQIILESLLLVTAVSIDAFVASLAYGTNRIKIPVVSVLIISAVCSIVLAVSLFFGMLVSSFVPAGLTKICCCAILVLLGIIKLFDSTIKAYIRKRKTIRKKIAFSALHMNFILNVYANPEEADKDFSNILSPAEAVALSIALSFDSLAVGFGTAIASVNVIQVILLSFLMGVAAVVGGRFIGNKISENINIDLSWLSGVMLIILAMLKL